jgi:hypothetical protein
MLLNFSPQVHAEPYGTEWHSLANLLLIQPLQYARSADGSARLSAAGRIMAAPCGD